MAPKKKAKRAMQTALPFDQYSLLKKPLDHLGKQIKIDGGFWGGRISASERETEYLCSVIDFSLMHKSGPDADYCKAFKLQEMGTDGKGSLEISDLESTRCGMAYRRSSAKSAPLDSPFDADEPTGV
jgi:hypothetical protein